MVKGISRRVIMVDSPDTELFEQAIFIVRDEILSNHGVTAQMLVDEACRVARSCTHSKTAKRRRFAAAAPFLWGSLGAGTIGIIWMLWAVLPA